MKNIELTENQKVKLLEMCNKLFWNGCMNKNDFRENNILLIAIDKNYKYNHKILSIHWFEFCWTLLNKILESNLSPIKSCEIIKEFGLICFNKFESLHPVNYLYEQFKKLEL